MVGDNIEMDGIVIEICRGGKFKVRCEIQGPNGKQEHIVLAHPSGKIRKFGITIVVGDLVQVEVSPYSLGLGRIVFRKK